MNTLATQKDVGASLRVVTGQVPVLSAANAALKGAAIDRSGFNSCVLHQARGAADGGPSAHSLDSQVQHSDTTTDGDFEDLPGVEGSAVALTAAGQNELDINLSGAKRYIRVVSVIAFTDGSTPKIPIAVTVVLGGATEPPTD
jgi:hypothetical protein